MIETDLYTKLPSGEYAKAPFRVLVLNYYHHTMDMSVANYSERRRMIILPPNLRLPIESEDWCGCGKTTIVGFDDNGSLMLKWRGRDYVCDKEEVETETIYLDNPYLSREEVSMRYEYVESIDAISVASCFLKEVREWQDEMKRSTLSTEMEDNRELALQSLWYAIDNKGLVGLYPSYALMKSCKNWASFTITDWAEFERIMKQAIKAGCFDAANDYTCENLAEVFRFNSQEEVYSKVPALKSALNAMALGGNEMAEILLHYKIDCIEKTSREDPELTHFILEIEGEEDEYIEHYYNLLVDDEIVAGTTIDMGEYGKAEIANVSSQNMEFVWQGDTYELVDQFYRKRLSPVELDNGTEIDFTARYRRVNLWAKLKDLISIVSFDQVSSNIAKKGCISQKKACALALVQRLIEQGDEKLTALYTSMKEQEEWKCFEFDGELNYLMHL